MVKRSFRAIQPCSTGWLLTALYQWTLRVGMWKANGLMRESGSVGRNYNARKGNIYLQHGHRGAPDYVLKYNIPKQKEINQQHVHTPNEPRHTSNESRTDNKPLVAFHSRGLLLSLGFLYRYCNHVTFHFARLDWSGLSSNPDNARIASYPSQRHWSMRSYLERTEFCSTVT